VRPSLIVGPLTHQQEERDHLLNRARRAGMSTDLLDRVLPPLTPEEKNLADEQDHPAGRLTCEGRIHLDWKAAWSLWPLASRSAARTPQ